MYMFIVQYTNEFNTVHFTTSSPLGRIQHLRILLQR